MMHPNRVSAALCTGHEPGGIPVGLAQTACPGELLSGQPGPTAHYRTQQAQEPAKAPLDHRRLLAASYAVVMS